MQKKNAIGANGRTCDVASYVDKQQFIGELSEALKSVLTVTEMEQMQSVLLGVLSGYEMERCADNRDSVAESADFLQMYIDAKAIEGRTDKTLARYQFVLNTFFRAENVTAHGTTVYHIRDYFMKEKKRGIADSTIAGVRDVLNSFYGWLFNEGLIPKNPCANVGTIRQEKKVRKPYSSVEVQKILEGCKCLRDKAIVLFLLNTGCRISELSGINVEDVDLKNRECVVYGKGRKERTIFFDEVTAWVLAQHIETQEANGPLFTGKRHERLQPNGIRCMLKDIEKRTGVENIHPHRFRRTFATSVINHGMAIQDVAAILGHEMLDTTMKYVYQSKERTRNAYEAHTA